jgi:hypothetical protein
MIYHRFGGRQPCQRQKMRKSPTDLIAYIGCCSRVLKWLCIITTLFINLYVLCRLKFIVLQAFMHLQPQILCPRPLEHKAQPIHKRLHFWERDREKR